MKPATDPVRRPGPKLLLRVYAIGIATAIGIAGSWYAAHHLIRFTWPQGTAMGLEALHDVPSRWGNSGGAGGGALQEELVRLRRGAGVRISAYDARGALVASNAHPPLPAPSPAEQERAAHGVIRRGFGAAVTQIRRGDVLLGFCVFDRDFPDPPLWGVVMDLLIISTWISAVGLLTWRTLVRPLQRIAEAAESFGEGNMAARTGVERRDEIGKVARAFDDMSERIARSREAERELLASLSHELRTPLARIRVALDLAEEADAETARASLVDVAEDLTELETLISNIFSTTRLEMAAAARDSQPVPLQRTDVDLTALVQKAVAHQRIQHPDRPYTLDVSTADTSAPATATAPRGFYGDAVLIRRAIENVLDNAHKYSPADSLVTVTVDQEAGAFRIVIADRGFGIAPDDLPRVFSPFFRADRSRTRATGGVGLGLALARRVIEAHGGRIDVVSQIDAGTTVIFRLPTAADEPRDTVAPRHIS